MMRFLQLLFIITLFSPSMLVAQEPYIILPDSPVQPLDAYIQVYQDSTRTMSIDDIRNEASIEYLSRSELPERLDANSVYWVRLILQCDEEISNWLLQFESYNYGMNSWGRGNGKVDVYGFSENEQLFHKRTGADYPRRVKEIKEWWNLNRVQLDVKPEETLEIIARIKGTQFGLSPQINMVLRDPIYQHYQPLFNRHTFFVKFLLGIVFISLIYHFLMFIYLKSKVYGWFSLWLTFTLITIMLAVDVGLLSEYVIGNLPKSRLSIWLFSANCIWFTFWFFGRSFINTKSKFPKLDKWIVGLCAALFLEMLINLILVNLGSDTIRNQTSGIHYMLLGLFTLCGLVLAIVLAFKKDRLAKYFGVGAIFATLAPFLGGLWVNGIIKLPIDPYVWGIFLQIIAYSFGLAYRQQQQNKAFRNAQLQLVEAEKSKNEIQRMKDLDELKSKFFANISHEFRTPLSLIKGPLDLAEQSSANKDNVVMDSSAIDVIKRNANRLQNLVDQLLELSQLESGKVQLNQTDKDIIDTIRPLLASFNTIAEQKQIDFSINLSTNSIEGLFDAEKMETIIYNILSNAFKYTPQNGKVFFNLQHTENQLTISIQDSGIGLTQDEIKHIFDRFYRVEGSEEKGSGIGLALAKELVDLHNGTIEVQSKKDEGSTFTFSLPYQSTIAKTKEVRPVSIMSDTASTLSEMEQEESDSKLPLALIVEDNKDLQNHIKEIIQRECHVIIANNGLEGEELALQHTPNIIISDIMMPKKDGNELCKSLKTNVRTSHIPIILLTAKAGQESKMEGLTHGADAYITKPFDPDELIVRVQNLLKLREKIWKQFKSIDSSTVSDLSLSSMDDRFFQEVLNVIYENLDNENLSVEHLAKEVGFSRSQLHRKLKALINKSANQLIRETRLNRAKVLLENNTATVAEIAYQVGMTNLSYFSKQFKEQFGKLPSDV